MRLFHELVFDTFMEGATGFGGLESKVYWDPVMGGVEALRMLIVADQVTGTADDILLNVAVGERVGMDDIGLFTLTPVPNALLTRGQTNVLSATLTDPGTPSAYSCFLYVSLNGSNPKAHIRVWVTGRGRA